MFSTLINVNIYTSIFCSDVMPRGHHVTRRIYQRSRDPRDRYHVMRAVADIFRPSFSFYPDVNIVGRPAKRGTLVHSWANAPHPLLVDPRPSPLCCGRPLCMAPDLTLILINYYLIILIRGFWDERKKLKKPRNKGGPRNRGGA